MFTSLRELKWQAEHGFVGRVRGLQEVMAAGSAIAEGKRYDPTAHGKRHRATTMAAQDVAQFGIDIREGGERLKRDRRRS
jgi:hypothetical protein